MRASLSPFRMQRCNTYETENCHFYFFLEFSVSGDGQLAPTSQAWDCYFGLRYPRRLMCSRRDFEQQD